MYKQYMDELGVKPQISKLGMYKTVKEYMEYGAINVSNHMNTDVYLAVTKEYKFS